MVQHCFTRSAAFMAKPCIRSWNKLKRAARFKKLHQRRTREFIGQERRTVLKESADSDWARDPLMRKSISCYHTGFNKHPIESYVGTRVAFAVGVP